jgi:predicted lipoprotein
MTRKTLFFLTLGLATLTLPGCKFIKTEALAERAAASAKPTAAADAAGMWSDRVVPHLTEKAAPIADLRAAFAADYAGAGKTYGYRESAEGAPFNFVARISGTVVEANTQSRAATAGVDTDGDGKADVTLQLGPVIKGTSIRDALPFVSFTQYANQIEFADVAKSFNTVAYDRVLKDVPRDGLVGKTVEAVGVFTLRSKADKILVTPVSLQLAGAPS